MEREFKDLDRIDRRILQTLQKNGRTSNVDLAREVNLSPPPCLERVKRLEREGFIDKYVALVNPAKVDASLCAYIQISLDNTSTEALEAFNQEMLSQDEVLECHLVAGGFDYLVKIRVADMRHYQRFLGEKLGTTPGISQSHTYVVIEEVKSETSIPISL